MIRLLNRNDAPAYRNLRLQALQTDPTAFLATFDSEHGRSVQQFEYELAGAASNPGFGFYGLFAENGSDGNQTIGTSLDQTSQLIGFCQTAPSFLPKQAHLAFLFNLYIDSNYRQQGLAQQLLTHVLNQLKIQQKEIVVLSHIHSNQRAHQLYTKLGFVQTGIKPNTVKWQGQYDDEVDMVLDLRKWT